MEDSVSLQDEWKLGLLKCGRPPILRHDGLAADADIRRVA